MFLQGDLQPVFDALFAVGAIDPVLKMDWNELTDEMNREPHRKKVAFSKVNSCHGDYNELVNLLYKMDSKSVTFVALEVAREFCEFQDRKDLH